MANLALLLAVVGFVIKATPISSQSLTTNSSANSIADGLSGPLDQVSSADIAVNVARLARLQEATSVANHADSVNAELTTAQTNSDVVAKPQVISAALPSKKDIQKYTAVGGDTINSVATKLGVSSDSIKWSNGLSGSFVAAGTTIFAPPAGVSGFVYVVKSGDTPDSLATKYNTAKDRIINYNDADVSGLVVGDHILIPDGSIVTPSYSYSGFAFGLSAVYGFNGYDYGWCTWYVANRRAEIGRPVPSNLGDARSWYYIAQRAGLSTGLSPQVGAVAVNQGGDHVSVVEVVNGDGSFWVSEMNSRGQVSMSDPTPAGGWGRIDWKLIPSVGNLKFIY